MLTSRINNEVYCIRCRSGGWSNGRTNGLMESGINVETDRRWVLPALRKALSQSRTEATMSFCRFVESTEAESRQANRIAGFLSMHSLALAKQNEFPSQQLSAPSKLNVKRRNR